MSKKSSSHAYVNFEFTVKKLQIQPTAAEGLDPTAWFRVVWVRGRQATDGTQWKQLSDAQDSKSGATFRQAKWWDSGSRNAADSKHQFVVENLHVPVKGDVEAKSDKSDQKNKILEIKLFMRRDGEEGEGQQIGRTVRWKLELSREDAGSQGKPAKKKTGTLDIGDKGNIKDMQVSVSFQMQEVSPEVAQQAEQQRRAERKSRGLNPSTVTTEAAMSGVDSDGAGLANSRALATAQANEKERERERRDREAREAQEAEMRAQEAEQRRREEAAKLAQLEAQQFEQQQEMEYQDNWQNQIQSPYAHAEQQNMMHPGQHSQRSGRGHQQQQHPDMYSEDPQMPGNSVDVDKMKYQVLKLYHKLSEQGDQLEEKRRDLRQMHRLYVELKRDFEAAQEELDRREMRIGELQDQLHNELGERHELLRQQNETVQRKSRGYDAWAHETGVYDVPRSGQVAQRKNCECIIA